MPLRVCPALRARRTFTLIGLCAALLGGLVTSAMAQGPALDQVSVASPEVLARNKRNVLAFYDLAFNRSKPREAVERYVGATYIQHNLEVPDGKDGFIWHFERLARDYPDKEIVFKRVFAEGNHVIVHCLSQFPAWLGTRQWAGIDIFRLDDNGKIVEHWDVLQTVPRSSTNLNSMF
jgi:predicted SnoaL-like aldol condensation-catalyzing enzyme